VGFGIRGPRSAIVSYISKKTFFEMSIISFSQQFKNVALPWQLGISYLFFLNSTSDSKKKFIHRFSVKCQTNFLEQFSVFLFGLFLGERQHILM
jgi:hypothetical protein